MVGAQYPLLNFFFNGHILNFVRLSSARRIIQGRDAGRFRYRKRLQAAKLTGKPPKAIRNKLLSPIRHYIHVQSFTLLIQ